MVGREQGTGEVRDWRRSAACRDRDPEMFFPTAVDGPALERAEGSSGLSYIETRLDETNLRQIAQTANGTFYRASSQNALQDIFRRINQLEKAQIKETRFRDTRDFYQVYLTWAILVLLVWLLLKNTFLSNALED